MLVYIAFTLKTVLKLHTLDTTDGADISAARAQENCDVRDDIAEIASLVKSVMEQRDRWAMHAVCVIARARLGAERDDQAPTESTAQGCARA